MSAKVNPDLVRERKNATFNTLQLTHFLFNGSERVERKRHLQSLAFKDPIIKNSPDWHTLSREEKYAEAIRKSIYYVEQVNKLGITDPAEKFLFQQAIAPHEALPFNLHHDMFVPTLESQATDEQKARWLPLAYNYQMIGTYAQTELGHGTFVRGLETTATFDPITQEFIMDTPTLTSTKYWPGGLGMTSNVCLLMAQLIIRGKKYGLHMFLVPIRDLKTHQVLPGVMVGDIGTKFGYEGVDNGFLKLDKVRIPRTNMLMKYSKVTEDGTYIHPQSTKLVYGTMVFIRSSICISCAYSLAHGVTIATRYSAVRRQSELEPGSPEAQIIDYQTQQNKIFPALATAYALWFAGRHMMEIYLRVSFQMDKGSMEELPTLHGMSAGVKALSTWSMSTLLETCRMACGGHGYSNASGFSKIYCVATPAATYEGENTVMMLQTARFLLKRYAQVKKGEKQTGIMTYLNQPLGGSSSLTSDLDLPTLVSAFEHRALRLIDEAASSVERLVRSGTSLSDATNRSGVRLVAAATAHCQCFVLSAFVEKVFDSQLDSQFDSRLNSETRRVLTSVCRLFAVHNMLENLGQFMQDSYVSRQQAAMLNSKLPALLAEIRPNAVALVDAFDFPDQLLGSALGRYDGNVYEALFEYAKNSKLNNSEVIEAYYKYMKPFMEEQRKNMDVAAIVSKL